MKYFNLLFSFLFVSGVFGQQIFHEVSMPAPETHYFHVKTTLTDFRKDEVVLVMPVWSPGSYLIREFPNNVNLVRAKDGDNNVLKVYKISKNKWKIEKGNAKKVIVEYESYAFDLTVRTAFLDKTHGYFNGVNILTFPEGHKDLGGKISIHLPNIFEKVSAPLKQLNDGIAADAKSVTFAFKDFEELGDSPFEIGNQTVFSFDAAGVNHTVAMYGEGNYDIEKLKVDMAKIVESATAVFGQNPNKNYLFIIHNTEHGGGGLEHVNSTTLNVNRWTYTGDDYIGFLSLVAHEYFHLWNVKRLRPANLVDYDYSHENYTNLLWVMEGFTSYYDELLLRRAGFLNQEEYLRKLNGTLNYVEGTPGNKVQPVSHASYDAWIKAYRPNENSRNTTISYYSKGALVGSVVDAMIIKKYNGEKSLDDFMQLLYNKYFVKDNIGFKQVDFKKDLESFLETDLDHFFEEFIDGVATIPYQGFYGNLGVKVDKIQGVRKGIGASLSMRGGNLMVRSVQTGGAAEKSGLSVNDEIIACNGYRVNETQLQNFFNGMEVGDPFKLMVARDGVILNLTLNMGTLERTSYQLFIEDKNPLIDFWLRVTP